MRRATFLAASAAAALTTPGARRAAEAAPAMTRMEIEEFSTHSDLVTAFRTAVSAMHDVTDATNPESWTYWHYSHKFPGAPPPTPPTLKDVWNQCNHHMPYFAGWHRGYVYFFEQILRKKSGNANLTLPYWDYYKRNGAIPKIFADKKLPDGSKNPLYWPGRSKAVNPGYNAFSPAFTKFPTYSGATRFDNYEGQMENDPHDQVHDQVGGDMGSPATAPRDPIFYTHHCNIDRLWAAWTKAGGGRAMPSPTDPWWNVRWKYGVDPAWTLSLSDMAEPDKLGYAYSDLSLPTPPPVLLPARPAIRATAPLHILMARDITGASGLTLGTSSVSVALPLPAAGRSKLQSFAAAPRGARSEVVLEGVELTDQGKRGGYSYNVYLNLPAQTTTTHNPEAYYLGSLGSFSIQVEQGMHSGPLTIRFPLGAALHAQARAGHLRADQVTISFVRVGEPAGTSADAQFVKFARMRVGAAAATP